MCLHVHTIQQVPLAEAAPPISTSKNMKLCEPLSKKSAQSHKTRPLTLRARRSLRRRSCHSLCLLRSSSWWTVQVSDTKWYLMPSTHQRTALQSIACPFSSLPRSIFPLEESAKRVSARNLIYIFNWSWTIRNKSLLVSVSILICLMRLPVFSMWNQSISIRKFAMSSMVRLPLSFQHPKSLHGANLYTKLCMWSPTPGSQVHFGCY